MSSAAAASRVCPLLERETRTRVLDLAPAPWIVRECLDSGMVYLENPPVYERCSKIAWEQTWQQESQTPREGRADALCGQRAAQASAFRGLKRHKVADMTAALGQIGRTPSGEAVRVVDLGCGAGQLLGIVLERLPPAWRSRLEPSGVEISDELARQATLALARHGGRCVHASALDGMRQFDAHSLDLVMHVVLPRARKPADAAAARVPGPAACGRPRAGQGAEPRQLEPRLRGRRWCGYRWPDHVNYFTPATLRAMALRAGFEVERMNALDRLPFSDSLYAVLRKRTAP